MKNINHINQQSVKQYHKVKKIQKNFMIFLTIREIVHHPSIIMDGFSRISFIIGHVVPTSCERYPIYQSKIQFIFVYF